MKYVAEAAKAIFATISIGLASLGTALVDGKNLGDVTDAQWVIVIGAAIAGGYGVYQTGNKLPDPPAPTKSTE